MVDHDAESGRELVLDNRKLIIAFAVLIAICGCFFVVGFIEGKRQGFQEGNQTVAETAHKANPAIRQAQAPKPAKADGGAPPTAAPDAGAPDAGAAAKEGSVEQRLNWQKVVTTGETKDISLAAKGVKEPVKETEKKPAAESDGKTKPQANATHSEPVTYSVQIGAFRVRHEAESKAKMLRAKGYECRVEEPQSPEDLYLLKVGKYKSRAEAVAMQIRLKKSEPKSFVKTN
jgi:cell division protein FtsN